MNKNVNDVAFCWTVRHENPNRSFDVNPLSARILLSNNFESGSADPWYDNSTPSSVYWNVEDFSSPTEVNYPPPTPLSGTKYLRSTRNSQLSAGLVILRTVTFTAFPGDTMTFDFWIRSRYASGNALEVVMAAVAFETTILTLTSYSTAENFDWRPASVSLPVSEPTGVTLSFYGYCGSNIEDAIAIDNIVLETHDISTTEMVTTTTLTPQSPVQRTVIFIYKTTQVGQDLFIRGGIDSTIVRPVCQDDLDAETSECAVSVQMNSLGVGTPWVGYDAWRVGDTKLDWFGAQAGQGTYMGSPAFGTPLVWTTNNPAKPEYQPLNKWGDANHMVDFNMDCSETENGWFDVKAYLTNYASGWEADIAPIACTGTGADVLPPYSGTGNHMARCGYINRRHTKVETSLVMNDPWIISTCLGMKRIPTIYFSHPRLFRI
ncbi:uncharacterized protein LOC124349713 isoform X3 [Daphnia pulicaria]|uniref:uncharacterized protein LOC124349713 isoform X3 n=1 Tax=Daphnia pulicaria TaxID=35523 RepID=UPI001EEB12BC|nr:uncharacterized protein LOC124349713 isoform X3 [Daphnia pulicaria]XP_046656474.1 uncharacterized protein LOC124349713 isoform X3 [Daphnia pulicaria]XP_046656475.1 uncharacterized protein LOC124349713 isoform X3 [Daphnia pulicaria]